MDPDSPDGYVGTIYVDEIDVATLRGNGGVGAGGMTGAGGAHAEIGGAAGSGGAGAGAMTVSGSGGVGGNVTAGSGGVIGAAGAPGPGGTTGTYSECIDPGPASSCRRADPTWKNGTPFLYGYKDGMQCILVVVALTGLPGLSGCTVAGGNGTLLSGASCDECIFQ